MRHDYLYHNLDLRRGKYPANNQSRQTNKTNHCIKKHTHTLPQTNSGDKHCEFSHFCKLDVSYAIQHTFSNVILGDRLRK